MKRFLEDYKENKEEARILFKEDFSNFQRQSRKIAFAWPPVHLTTQRMFRSAEG